MSCRGLNNSSIQLIIEKLNGKKLPCSQSIKLVIDGNEKLNYLTSKTEEPTSTNPISLQKWKSDNSMVTAWLVHPMKSSIGKTYPFLPTVKNVWNGVFETYLDTENFY